MSCISYLISVSSLRVRQLSRHELKEDYSVGVDVRLETVGIVILHPDDLRSLGTFREIRKPPVQVCLHARFCPPWTGTDHPQNGSGRLLHLMGAAPPALHRSQTKVADFHRQTFMQEDVFASVKETATAHSDASVSLFFYSSSSSSSVERILLDFMSR